MRNINDQAWKARTETRLKKLYAAARRQCFVRQVLFSPVVILVGLLALPAVVVTGTGIFLAALGKFVLSVWLLTWEYFTKTIFESSRPYGIALAEVKHNRCFTHCETHKSSRWHGKSLPRTPWGRQWKNPIPTEELAELKTESEIQENRNG